MARRKESGLDVVAALPWPFGVVLGVLAYVAIRHGVGWYFTHNGGPLLKTVGEQAAQGAYAPLAWMALALCWVGALVSYLNGRRRKRLLETQTGLDSLRSISWREFEMLVGEAFRRQGYRVEENGLGGADGGVDLVLHKGSRRTLVQCKQWRARQVSVATVREMWGLLAHHGADAVKIVCAHAFTRDAADFARGKPIELVTGQALLDLINAVRSTGNSAPAVAPVMSAVPPTCPRCQSAMAERNNRRSGELFWGCAAYPRCRGTRPIVSA